MGKNMDILERVLDELLAEASTALAALEKIAATCPSAIWEFSVPGDTRRTFRYFRWAKTSRGWVNVPDVFATFDIAADGTVTRYCWGTNVANPGGLLAAILRREREKLVSVAQLTDVPPAEN